jgi:hypothetical protein
MRVALYTPSALKRWTLGALTGLGVLAAVTLGGAVSAPAAHAAGCTTGPTHAYLTMPGRAFVGFDNLDGINRPIETFSYVQGQASFRLGANGVQPGTPMGFFAFNRNTGANTPFIPGDPDEYGTRGRANSNCIVNEEGPFSFTLPPGDYQIVARYIARFLFYVNVPVVNLHVTPAPPPPPPLPPVDPGCVGIACSGGVGGDN